MNSITPFLVQKPWGGDFLAPHYHSALTKIGEAWLLSTLPEGESLMAGKPLSQVLGRQLTFLVKVLDTSEPLSVQVHPDDAWAQQLEHSRGKTECWLILDAKPGAGVYLGLRPGVRKVEFEAALKQNRGVPETMQFHPVRRGDFISVPAGTIHAIGAGVTLLEVQQASGITYRLWDWDRPAREMHVEKGMQVSNFEARHGILFNVFDSGAPRSLLTHTDFNASFGQSSGPGWFVDLRALSVGQAAPAAGTPYVFVR